MNDDTMETAEKCAKDAGAIVKCRTCGHENIRTFDREAERQTYARATNEWKFGGGGFRGMDLKEVKGTVKSVLDGGNLKCPKCGSL